MRKKNNEPSDKSNMVKSEDGFEKIDEEEIIKRNSDCEDDILDIEYGSC